MPDPELTKLKAAPPTLPGLANQAPVATCSYRISAATSQE